MSVVRYLLLCAVSILLWSCNGHGTGNSSGIAKNDTSFLPPDYDYKKLEKTYSGDFGGSDIHLSLRHVNGRHAMGYSLHKGLKRNFYGTMKPDSAGFRFVLSEPGNNEFDGVFDFRLDTATMHLTGKWQPNDIHKTTDKLFVLTQIVDRDLEYVAPYEDSIGVLTFEQTGICTYENYHDEQNKDEPAVMVKGNWIKKDNTFIIDWQPNSVFPSRRTELKIERDVIGDPADSSYRKYIRLGDRKLMENEAG